MVAFVRNGLVKMILRLFQPLSVVMTMVPMLLRQFRRNLQIKKSIKTYRSKRVSQMLLMCYNLLNSQKYTYQSITVKKGWLLEHLLKKLQKLHRKKNNNCAMVNFIHNGSEITTWMGYSFKTKSKKSKATFLRQEHLF